MSAPDRHRIQEAIGILASYPDAARRDLKPLQGRDGLRLRVGDWPTARTRFGSGGSTGTLWEGRYMSFLVEAESYLLLCQRYIELNPFSRPSI